MSVIKRITQDKWTFDILTFMNKIKPFDLSGVDFKAPIDGFIEDWVVEKRSSFYKVQMDILKKTANMVDTQEELEEEHAV